MAEVILQTRNLTKKYGDKEVLKGVNLEIHAGEIFGIIGSSGSGKTTLLNSLIGFVPPTTGEVLFRDPHLLSYNSAEERNSAFRNVLQYPTEVKEIFGFAAQDPSVYGKLTVMENLDLFGSLYHLSKEGRKTNAHILLKLMGLYNSRKFYATNLSGGMIKRLDIACSLIHDPKILILDEPTADLDPYLRRTMWDLIRKIKKKGTTIIISSHYLDEIEELCDRIGVMSNGQMQNYGTPQEIKKMNDGYEEIHLRTEYRRYDVLEKKIREDIEPSLISQIRSNGTELIIKTKKPLPIVEFIIASSEKIEDPILDLRLNKPSLNEIFASFVEQSHGGNLAMHQQQIEEEAMKLLEQKWWYKLQQKFFPKKSRKRRNDVESDKDANELDTMSSRKRSKSRFSFLAFIANVFSKLKPSPKRSSSRRERRVESPLEDDEFDKSAPKTTVGGIQAQSDSEISPAPIQPKVENEIEDQLSQSNARESNSSSSSFSNDSDLDEIRRRIEELKKQTSSFDDEEVKL